MTIKSISKAAITVAGLTLIICAETTTFVISYKSRITGDEISDKELFLLPYTATVAAVFALFLLIFGKQITTTKLRIILFAATSLFAPLIGIFCGCLYAFNQFGV